jgi:hypothetical protein
MCPHKRAFVLSRGILGSQGETSKIACPLHKKTFSLETGECLSGGEHALKVFPVRVVGDLVQLLLPSVEQLDALLATDLHQVSAWEARAGCSANGASTSASALAIEARESEPSAAP